MCGTARRRQAARLGSPVSAEGQQLIGVGAGQRPGRAWPTGPPPPGTLKESTALPRPSGGRPGWAPVAPSSPGPCLRLQPRSPAGSVNPFCLLPPPGACILGCLLPLCVPPPFRVPTGHVSSSVFGAGHLAADRGACRSQDHPSPASRARSVTRVPSLDPTQLCSLRGSGLVGPPPQVVTLSRARGFQPQALDSPTPTPMGPDCRPLTSPGAAALC